MLDLTWLVAYTASLNAVMAYTFASLYAVFPLSTVETASTMPHVAATVNIVLATGYATVFEAFMSYIFAPIHDMIRLLPGVYAVYDMAFTPLFRLVELLFAAAPENPTLAAIHFFTYGAATYACYYSGVRIVHAFQSGVQSAAGLAVLGSLSIVHGCMAAYAVLLTYVGMLVVHVLAVLRKYAFAIVASHIMHIMATIGITALIGWTPFFVAEIYWRFVQVDDMHKPLGRSVTAGVCQRIWAVTYALRSNYGGWNNPFVYLEVGRRGENERFECSAFGNNFWYNFAQIPMNERFEILDQYHRRAVELSLSTAYAPLASHKMMRIRRACLHPSTGWIADPNWRGRAPTGRPCTWYDQTPCECDEHMYPWSLPTPFVFNPEYTASVPFPITENMAEFVKVNEQDVLLPILMTDTHRWWLDLHDRVMPRLAWLGPILYSLWDRVVFPVLMFCVIVVYVVVRSPDMYYRVLVHDRLVRALGPKGSLALFGRVIFAPLVVARTVQWMYRYSREYHITYGSKTSLRALRFMAPVWAWSALVNTPDLLLEVIATIVNDLVALYLAYADFSARTIIAIDRFVHRWVLCIIVRPVRYMHSMYRIPMDFLANGPNHADTEREDWVPDCAGGWNESEMPPMPPMPDMAEIRRFVRVI